MATEVLYTVVTSTPIFITRTSLVSVSSTSSGQGLVYGYAIPSTRTSSSSASLNPTSNSTLILTQSNQSSSSAALNKGLIVGLVFGGIALIAVIFAIWFCSIRAETWRERRYVDTKTSQLPPPSMPAIAGGATGHKNTRSLSPPPEAAKADGGGSASKKLLKSKPIARLSQAFKPRHRTRSPPPPSPIPLQQVKVHNPTLVEPTPIRHEPAAARSLEGFSASPSIAEPPKAHASSESSASRSPGDAAILGAPAAAAVPLNVLGASTVSSSSGSEGKVYNYRIDHIPSAYANFEAVLKLINPMDRDQVMIRSLCPSAHYSQAGKQTATIEFAPSSSAYSLPSLTPEAESQGVTVDKTFHGFTSLSDPTSLIQADVIAVSGFGDSSAFKSFGLSSRGWNQFNWLRDRLARDFPTARILMYGHESTSRQDEHMSLDDHAQEFQQKLKEQTRRPVIFIGHSLGGLLVKKALVDHKNWGTGNFLIPTSPLAIFLGTPHGGLDVEALYSLNLRKPPSRLAEDLRPGSETLKTLQAEFFDVCGSLQILSIYERESTPIASETSPGKWGVDGREAVIAGIDNSQCWMPNERSVASENDHRVIARLEAGDENYADILKQLSKVCHYGQIGATPALPRDSLL